MFDELVNPSSPSLFNQAQPAPLAVAPPLPPGHLPASKLDKDFWKFMFSEDIESARALLHYDPGFIPTLNDYCFRKMEVILSHPATRTELLRFLHGNFPLLFQSRYQNGQYVLHLSHFNNIRTLLEVFPYDRNLRIALLDELISSPNSPFVLDDSFFNFIINNEALLRYMFNTRPDLFLVDHHQLPDGSFKRKLPMILTKLAQLFQDNKAIKMAYFKISED